MNALTESVTLSKIKNPSCTLLLFEIILCLAAFSFSRAQSIDTTILPDDPDLKPSDERNVCYTPECKRTASRVLSYVNASLDPCDNFYKFACGQFITTNLIHGVNSVDHYSTIQNNIHRQMMNYLQNETLPTLPRYARLIKTFFNSCIDDYSNKAENRHFNSVMEFVNKTNGWPLLKNYSWENENFQWEKFGSQGQLMNIFILFSTSRFWTSEGFKSVPLIMQPKKFVTSQKLYNNLLSFGQLFGVEKHDVEKSLNQMLEVNNKLHGIYSDSTRDYFTHKKMTVNELVQKYPNVSWKEFFDTRVKPKKINDDDVIYVQDISYIDKFNELIPTISKGDLANYLMWRATSKILASYFDSINTQNYPFKICFDNTFENFGIAWKFLYVKNNFNNDSFPNDIDEMFHNSQEEFIAILKNNYWLDNSTKLKLLEDLESINFESPNQYFSHDKEIDEYYKSLEITPGDYLRSLSNVTEFNNKDRYYIYRKPYLRGQKRNWKFLYDASNVNSYYHGPDNIIGISAAFCQGVLYDKERPKYMNYGSLGTTISHEITHSVDSTDGSFDNNRSFTNLWTSEAKAKHARRVECILNRQQNYRVRKFGFNLNDYRSLRDDIADYVGIKVGYSAYERYMETHGPEPLLPGVNYTQRQLFWISFAQTECAVKTAEELKYIDKYTDYSIPELRVIGSLSNSFEFANDFQCATYTKMNPKDKCTVW